MLTFLFMVLMLMVFGKIIGFSLKAAWGVSKIICTIVLLPLFLIVLVFMGLIGIAFPILLVIGIISLFTIRN